MSAILVLTFSTVLQASGGSNRKISIWDLDLTLQLFFLALLLLSIYSFGKILTYKTRLDRHREDLNNLRTQIPREEPKVMGQGYFKNNSLKKEKKPMSHTTEHENVQKDHQDNIHASNNVISTPEYNDNPLTTNNSENVEEAEIISPTLDLSPHSSTERDAMETIEKQFLYLKAPDDEKAFYAPEATETPDHETVYALEGTELKLFAGMKASTMNTVMASSDIYIKRVCQIINVKEPQHTQFVMVDPGEVIKENEDFVVTKKMKVKYI